MGTTNQATALVSAGMTKMPEAGYRVNLKRTFCETVFSAYLTVPPPWRTAVCPGFASKPAPNTPRIFGLRNE
jgi:hypothetical protein